MEALFTMINVVVLIIFIIMLNIMARKHISFPKRVFSALGIGIVLGIALHLIFGAESKVLKQTSDWFSIIGDGYVALLQMIVMPLIFVSIVAAFSKIQIGINLRKSVPLFLCFNWNRSDCSHCRHYLCIDFRSRRFIDRFRKC